MTRQKAWKRDHTSRYILREYESWGRCGMIGTIERTEQIPFGICSVLSIGWGSHARRYRRVGGIPPDHWAYGSA